MTDLYAFPIEKKLYKKKLPANRPLQILRFYKKKTFCVLGSRLCECSGFCEPSQDCVNVQAFVSLLKTV